MIPLGIVPARVWWALGGIAALGLAVWWHQAHAASSIKAAVEADRVQLQAAAQTKLAAAELRATNAETKAGLAILENQHEQAERERARVADLDRLRRSNDGLQRTIAALRSGGGAQGQAASAISIVDAAPQLADALSQCSAEYGSVAAVADRLTGQLIDLQDYITDVVGVICPME